MAYKPDPDFGPQVSARILHWGQEKGRAVAAVLLCAERGLRTCPGQPGVQARWSPLLSFPAGAEPRQGSGNVSGALKAGGLVSRSQPQTWVPQPGQLAGRLRGSRSEERILNHIYMCISKKGKEGGREPSGSGTQKESH